LRLHIAIAIAVLLLLSPLARLPPAPGSGGEALAHEPGPGPLAFDNETVYHGNLVVNGTRKLVIRNVNFTLFGSIIAKDHATVIVENAILILNLTEMYQYNITMMDYSNLTIRNSLVRSASDVFLFNLYLFNETRAYFEEAMFENSLEWYGSAEVVVKNSRVRWVTCYGSVVVNVTNSEVQIALSASDNARVWLWETRAAMLLALSRATLVAVDCVVFGLGIRCYHDATVWLINVTGPDGAKPDISFRMAEEAVAYVAWHVRSIVVLEGRPVEGADVVVFFPNGSTAARGLTNEHGEIAFDLLECVMRPSGPQYVGNYTLRASYGQLLGEAKVEVRGNVDVHIDLLATLVITCLDGDGEPVGGVRLELSRLAPQAPSRVRTSTTNASGMCTFVLLGPGSYVARAYLMGVEVGSASPIEITSIRVYELVLSCAINDLIISVVDQGGSPIEGAHVVLALPNGTEIADASTNASGTAIFENIPARNYTIYVEAEGFSKASLEVSLEHEDQLEIIKLEPVQPERPLPPTSLLIGGIIAACAIPLLAILILKKRRKAGTGGAEEASTSS